MSLNSQMHERNPYKDKPPDFKLLAQKFPEFRLYCKYSGNGRVHVDFHKDAAVRELTRAILKHDFDLQVELPHGCLVPRIPQKLNYLLLIEDLLQLNGFSDNIRGVDVGTGASCIYALLGARHFGWKFVGTDSNEVAVKVASRNVANNELANLVNILKVDGNAIFSQLDFIEEYHFCVCNPPFFEAEESEKKFVPADGSSVDDCASLANRLHPVFDSEKDDLLFGRAPPKSATNARQNELEIQGGEVSFVTRMIRESISIGTKIKFYSSMLGKKSSVNILKQELSAIPGVKCSTLTLNQGRTQRWVLFWTFANYALLEKPKTLTLAVDLSPLKCPSYIEWLRQELQDLNIILLNEAADSLIECVASSCTWTAGELKRKRRNQHNQDLDDTNEKKPRMQVLSDDMSTLRTSNDSLETFNNRGGKEVFKNQVPSPPSAILRFSIHLSDSGLDTAYFNFVNGRRQLLNQLAQYFRSRVRDFVSTQR